MEEKPKTIIYKGVKFNLQQGYYRRIVQLHRQIWEDHFGKIPDDYHIHHKNGDKTDNRIENLECLHVAEHRKIHNSQKEIQYQVCKIGSKLSLRKKRKWDLFQQGKNIKAENSKVFWSDRGYFARLCVICGKEFQTRSVKTKNMCCSNACRCFKYRLKKWGLFNDVVSSIKR